ncbi:hypothetical protein B0T19DRAFT_443370 [Cercophora scortea]|uniref:DUF7053 domain-containing protein n=1 Tax=Cercophora scortea TaxID=314031 RepID=A0AAE0IF54_9PEZI|nr:hypothetical protein B0T19DRAFT_443370 [Cercophora scortea]
MSPMTMVTRVPLPESVNPVLVIEALHAYLPLIEANPYHIGHERRPVNLDEVVADPFFHDDGQKLAAFVVHDRIPIIKNVGSWATKDVVIPCVFQSFEYGVRCRADASGGVTVRSSYEVRPRGQVQGGPEDIVRPGEGDHELVEIATIDCLAIMKLFVKQGYNNAHQEILQRVVDGLVRTPAPQPEHYLPQT